MKRAERTRVRQTRCCLKPTTHPRRPARATSRSSLRDWAARLRRKLPDLDAQTFTFSGLKPASMDAALFYYMLQMLK